MIAKRSTCCKDRRRIPENVLIEAKNVIGVMMADTGSIGTLRTAVFPPTPDQIANVRTAVTETVAGHPASSEICLLASELATNSLRHSGTRFVGLKIDRMSGGVRVAVVDEGRAGFPRLDEGVSLDAEGGRGLRIVEGMTRRWGIIRRPGTGVAVWFEYAEPPDDKATAEQAADRSTATPSPTP